MNSTSSLSVSDNPWQVRGEYLVFRPGRHNAYHIPLDQVSTSSGLDDWRTHLRSKTWCWIQEFDSAVERINGGRP
jgi:hypothetical protein